MELRSGLTLLLAISAAVVFSVPHPLSAQAPSPRTNANPPAATVPFVGCVSYGQTDRLEAPRGTVRSFLISVEDARKVAYYSSADGLGMLAPRGWSCEGASGSDGYALVISPEPFDRTTPGWEGFTGPAIELRHINSENSGRYEVAEIMGRIFPAYRGFARKVWRDLDAPFPSAPYPKDRLQYKSERIVEYRTPPYAEGLGTHFCGLKQNSGPVSGVAILVGHQRIDAVFLSARLPPGLARLSTVIVQKVEREATVANRQ